MPFDGIPQTAHKAELRTTRKWTFIVFLKDGRTVMASRSRRRRKTVERFIERRVREIDSFAKPMTIIRTGGIGYRWKNFSHAIPMPAP